MTKEALIKLFEDETGNSWANIQDGTNQFDKDKFESLYWKAFSNWLIERLAKKDAEIERLKEDLSATNRLNIEQAGMLVDRDVRAERLQSAHDKQSETIQKQAEKIAMLVKQVEANGECHKGLTAKPCHCEVIKSAHDKLKQRISGADNIRIRDGKISEGWLTDEKWNDRVALVALVELTPEEMEKNDE